MSDSKEEAAKKFVDDVLPVDVSPELRAQLVGRVPECPVEYVTDPDAKLDDTCSICRGPPVPKQVVFRLRAFEVQESWVNEYSGRKQVHVTFRPHYYRWVHETCLAAKKESK